MLLAYDSTVDNTTTSASVTPTSANPEAKIEVRANFGAFGPVASGAVSAPLPLNVGANPIDIRVTAKDGAASAIYTVMVTRAAPAAADANLAALATSAGQLSPAFSRGHTFYSVHVPDSVGSVTVTPSAAQGGAPLAVRANGGAFSGVGSGAASAPLSLNGGANLIEVKVTAPDGVTVQSYTIIVTRIVDTLFHAGSDAGGKLAVSSDGRFVAFASNATDLVANDTNNRQDVFVYDRNAQVVERVSIGNGGAEGDNDSSNPSLSADGRYVAFQSHAGNLVPGDSNGQIDAAAGQDIFVYDRTAKTIERVSVRDTGGESNQASETPSIARRRPLCGVCFGRQQPGDRLCQRPGERLSLRPHDARHHGDCGAAGRLCRQPQLAQPGHLQRRQVCGLRVCRR